MKCHFPSRLLCSQFNLARLDMSYLLHIMHRAALFDAYVLRPGLSRPAVVSSTHTVYSATNLFPKSLRVFTGNT